MSDRSRWVQRRPSQIALSAASTVEARAELSASPSQPRRSEPIESAQDRLSRLSATESDARSLRSQRSSSSLRAPGEGGRSRELSVERAFDPDPSALDTTAARRSPAKRQKLEVTRPDGWRSAQVTDTIAEDPSRSLILANEGGLSELAPMVHEPEPDSVPTLPAPAPTPSRSNATAEVLPNRRASWFGWAAAPEIVPPRAVEPEPAMSEPSSSTPVESPAPPNPDELAPAPAETQLHVASADLARSSSGWLSYLYSSRPAPAPGPAAVAATVPTDQVAPVEAAPAPLAAPIDLPTRPTPAASTQHRHLGSPHNPPSRSLLSSSRGSAIRDPALHPPSGVLETDKAPAAEPQTLRQPTVAVAPVIAAQPHVAAISTPAPRASWFHWGQSPALPQSGTPSPEVAVVDVVSPAAQLATPESGSTVPTPAPVLESAPSRGAWFGWPAAAPAPAPAANEVPAKAGLGIVSPPDAMPNPPVALNPIVDTLPGQEAIWARWFGSRRVARPAHQVRGVEEMEIDWNEPGAPPSAATTETALRPRRPQTPDVPPSRSPAPSKEAPKEPAKIKSAVPPLTESKSAKRGSKGSPSQPPAPAIPNLVLPTFEDTFARPPRSKKPRDQQASLRRAVSMVKGLISAPGPPDPRVEAADRLPRKFETLGLPPQTLEGIRRVAVIGIHGFFYAPVLRRALGEPTGTSQRFANAQADVVRAYFASKGRSLTELTVIPLEGEGQVEARVDLLLNILKTRKEWHNAVKQADAVFFATHSQGSPVSVALITRLISDGDVDARKVTLLCMASVASGPFISLSTSAILQPWIASFESTAAKELFSFQDPASSASLWYRQHMATVLEAGVKVLAVASLDDQVVPVYSGVQHQLEHPSLLRAVFIDGSAFATGSFISNLVIFALHLRNAGIPDQDLVPLLSDALAGSLTGLGHSKIYDEPAVYELAVRFHFETTNAPRTPLIQHHFDPRARSSSYALPWALRGLLEDERVRDLFGDELVELRETFEDWHPVSKALRDIRRALEPLRLIPRKHGPAPAATTPVPGSPVLAPQNKPAKL